MAAAREQAGATVGISTVAHYRAGVRLRCVIADASPYFLELLLGFIEKEDLVDVVAVVSDGAGALDAVCRLRPDVAVLGTKMPRMSGLTASILIKQFLPDTRVVVSSSDDSTIMRTECRDCGADGFLYKPRFMVELEEMLLPQIPMRRPRGF